ncbi:MAG: hypothetical protein IJQ16_01055 [Selenomonadaceae bacterium]|nr:hypothetical protein [Selenomonadaceae bacterium]
MEKESPAYIEFELHLNCGGAVSNFEKLNELLKKICEAHEGKRELHIKVIGQVF